MEPHSTGIEVERKSAALLSQSKNDENQATIADVSPAATTAIEPTPRENGWLRSHLSNSVRILRNLARFAGPGAIISVAYVDPDNYQTAIAAGVSFQYKLLFMIIVSNLIAIYLQVSYLGI
jgi:hypothetical protein